MEIVDWGISRLTLLPVRSEPGDKFEMSNQLLFGEHYSVVGESKDREWLKIINYFDNYEGWIDRKQHYSISEEYFQQVNNSDYKISLDIYSTMLFHKNKIPVLLGSIIPISTNEIFKMEEQLAFDGESKSLGQKREFDFLKLIALKYLNAPYLWGGKSPFGIDCSGFAQQVFKICGYKIPRDSSQQAEVGEKLGEFGASKPGDLAFFSNKRGKIAHVGIILEDGRIIHASGKVRVDQISEKGIINEETGKMTHTLVKIKRVLKEI